MDISGQHLSVALSEQSARDDDVRRRKSLMNRTPSHTRDSVSVNSNLEERRADENGGGSVSDTLQDLTWRYRALHRRQEYRRPFDSPSCSAITGNTCILASAVFPVSRTTCAWYVSRGRPSFVEPYVRSNASLGTVGYLCIWDNRWPESSSFTNARGKRVENATQGDEDFTPAAGAQPPHGSYLKQRGNTVCGRYLLKTSSGYCIVFTPNLSPGSMQIMAEGVTFPRNAPISNSRQTRSCAGVWLRALDSDALVRISSSPDFNVQDISSC